MSPDPARAKLPSWVILPLAERLTPEELCEQATEIGVSAELTSEGIIQFPGGFLGWIDPRPLAPHLLDDGASSQPAHGGQACLHLSGGTLELERQLHATPAAIRAATAGIRENTLLMTTPPGQEQRIISGAALKMERLTKLIVRPLMELAEGLILPNANDVTFSAAEFLERSEEYLTDGYHFPLYAVVKSRSDEDGPYAVTVGMFPFGLPDLALPLAEGVSPEEAAEALGGIQREMVAEGWWPEHGSTFDTVLGSVHLEQVMGGIFVVPTEGAPDPQAVANARYRFARERLYTPTGSPGIMHRVRPPGLMVDHFLRPDGGSFAVSNGVGLTVQKGGTKEDENERVEIAIVSPHVGTWATGWIEWIADLVRGGDGSHTVCPFDRMVLEEPDNGIGGCILWPRGDPMPFGSGAPIHTWSMVPILVDELAHFRANPGSQSEWIKERLARGETEALSERWSRVVPAR